MKIRRLMPLTAAIMIGTTAIAAPATAEQKAKAQNISLISGHNVVDAVDDLRETTADLIGAILEANEGGLALVDWEKKEAKLDQMEENLERMEVTLDRKAEASDSSWLNWFEDRDYSVTVKDQITTLASYLGEMASMLKEAEKKSGLQVVVGHNLVDQVDDVRETTADLLNAIDDAGPEWGWFDENERFDDAIAQLDKMERTLDQKAEMTDAQWEAFISSPDYRVTVHQQIDTLSSMLSNLADQISTGKQVSQTNR